MLTLIEVANARINSFAHVAQQAEVSPEEPIFVLTGSQLQEIVTRAVLPLQAELQDRIEALEGMVEFQGKEIKALRVTQPGITASRVDDAFEAINDIDEHLARIDRTRTTAPPQGSKTIARIAKIDQVLKDRGSTTLKELERILKISPREMSRLVEKLDKRRFELHSRPGDNRERVLRLKVQIR